MNAAGRDATKQSAMFQKFIDVLKQQEYMSAMGQGKELRIGFAEYLGKRDLRHKAICSTGKLAISMGWQVDGSRISEWITICITSKCAGLWTGVAMGLSVISTKRVKHLLR